MSLQTAAVNLQKQTVRFSCLSDRNVAIASAVALSVIALLGVAFLLAHRSNRQSSSEPLIKQEPTNVKQEPTKAQKPFAEKIEITFRFGESLFSSVTQDQMLENIGKKKK
ncbi:MAG: hypothetical protein KDK44_05185, partial [Chlamydiia bacterium]|nr:hypothetical protein [Chlamydiia bacterium]